MGKICCKWRKIQLFEGDHVEGKLRFFCNSAAKALFDVNSFDLEIRCQVLQKDRNWEKLEKSRCKLVWRFVCIYKLLGRFVCIYKPFHARCRTFFPYYLGFFTDLFKSALTNLILLKNHMETRKKKTCNEL